MEGRPPPDEAGASSIPDNLQENFSTLNIGTRKKDNLATYDIKETDIPSEEDIDIQDVNTLENWNTLDRITIDGSESSEWGRSISSSMSWFDESEQEATLKVKGMMDNIEKVLYGEVHSPLPKPLMDECHQWRQKFPHLRVLGKGLGKPQRQAHDDQSSSEDESAHTIVESKSNSREGLDEGKEADEEEVIASHGKVEMLPVLSHEFQNHQEALLDDKSESIKERLLNEVTAIIWKEVVIPNLKPIVDKIIEGKNRNPNPKSSDVEETCGTLRIGEQNEFPIDSNPISYHSNEACTSQSAREARTVERLADSFDDPFEFYRRHSEQLTYCESRFKNEFTSSETPTKLGHKSIKNKGNGKFHTNRNRKVRAQGRLTSYYDDDDDLDGRISKSSPREERNVISSRGPTRLRVVEELKPLEKSMAWSKSKNEGLQNSGKYLLPKQNRKLTLPAIDHGKTSTYVEPTLPSYVRSSSALPKLGPNNFKSSLSPYENKAGRISRGKRNVTSKYNQADPLELRTDATYRRISQLHPEPSDGRQGNNTTRSKRTRGQKSIGSLNKHCDES